NHPLCGGTDIRRGEPRHRGRVDLRAECGARSRRFAGTDTRPPRHRTRDQRGTRMEPALTGSHVDRTHPATRITASAHTADNNAGPRDTCRTRSAGITPNGVSIKTPP